MYIKDIRELKKNIRAKYRRTRSGIQPDQKERLDAEIFRRLAELPEYRNAKIVFTYVSKAEEVDTFRLIREATAAGKRVAVPLCLPVTRGMDFYEISSEADLAPGYYGVLEPVPSRCRLVEDLTSGLCIVPGLTFDSQGFRLGYGKGYYDRFLAAFSGITAGLCYSGCMSWNLPHGYYDRPVDLLITEKYTRRFSSQKSR